MIWRKKMIEHDFALPFAELSKASVAIAGGKGAQLGELTAAGIPVPPGFVVTTHAFGEFMKENKLEEKIAKVLAAVEPHDTDSVNAASEKIREMVLKGKTPLEVEQSIAKHYSDLGARFVAVRSSATAEDASAASWAGELDTYLNTTAETLLETVKKCWSSLYTPRAIFYRFEKGLANTYVSVGVVVQKMVESEVSGVAFTVNPVTQDRTQMIIEAGWGLGEAVVSGAITPDNYVVDKAEEMLLDVTVAEQEKMIVKKSESGGSHEVPVPHEKRGRQKLAGKSILELASVCKRIETHYGSPQDIEWAFEGGKFYIVQARPVTTLK